MKNRWMIALGLLAVAVAAYVGLRAYTAGMPGAAGHVPELAMRAEDLYKAFQDDEAKAGELYTGKLIEVSGTVRGVASSDGHMSVLLASGAALGAVVCEFAGPADEPAEGGRVSIKGYCAGFNFDVLLQRCAFTGNPAGQYGRP